MICVITGTNSFLANLIIYVSMLSIPLDLEFFKFSMILLTSSGCTLVNLKLHCLSLISLLVRAKGSPASFGKFCLSTFTLFTKKLFIILAKSFGFENILPSLINCVGGPPVVHPSQCLTFFQIELLLLPNCSNLFFCH